MLEFHPLANLFPLIEGDDFQRLVDDVRINGLLEPIIMLDGKILDGRNRYRAARAAGVFDERHDLQLFDGDDALTWVLSKNLHRRHLNESQRALVASRLETLGHGGRRETTEGQDAKLHPDRKTLGDMLNVSPRSIASAKKVIADAAPELLAAVERGELAVSNAEKLVGLSKPEQTRIVANTEPGRLKTVAKQVSRDAKEVALADRQRALPTRLYNVILADPAWRFEPYSRATGMDRAADNHYPTQETGDIMALPVGTLAANDCVLFLWATAPMLCEALRVMRFWGFDYKTNFTWDKQVAGTGYWSRNRHEHLLIGTRGNIPAPAPGTQWDSVISALAGSHSTKPDASYQLIEDYFPHVPKIELNARRARQGWDSWGLEAPGQIDLDPALAPGHTDLMVTPEAIDAFLEANPLPDLRPFRSTPETDAAIRAAYAAPDFDLTRTAAELGATKLQIRRRANQLDLGSRDRQRAAVSAANARRASASNA